VLRENTLLNTSTASSSFLLVNRNFGDSGRKKRITAPIMLGRALMITNSRHDLNAKDNHGRLRAQL
jgi:hypothetical protein